MLSTEEAILLTLLRMSNVRPEELAKEARSRFGVEFSPNTAQRRLRGFLGDGVARRVSVRGKGRPHYRWSLTDPGKKEASKIEKALREAVKA